MDLRSDPEVLATFKGEAEDRLAELEQGLADLRGAIGAQDAVHEMFRAAHSLKATANLLDFSPIEERAKVLEERLQHWRKAGHPPDAAALDGLRDALDAIGLLIDDL